MQLRPEDQGESDSDDEVRRSDLNSEDEQEQDLQEKIYSELTELEQQQAAILHLLDRDSLMMLEQIRELEGKIDSSIKILEAECNGIEVLMNTYEDVVSASNMKRASDCRQSQSQRLKNSIVWDID